MTPTEFLDTLESRSLLPGEVLSNLRQQVSRSIKIVTAESLAKLLVGKGLITAFQSEQLLASAKPAAVELDDEMSLAPLDDDKSSKSTHIATPAPTKPAAPSPAPAKPVAASKPVAAVAIAPKPVAAKPPTVQPQAAAPAKKAASAVPTPSKSAPKATAASSSASVSKPAPQADPFGFSDSTSPLDDLLGDPLSGNSLLGDPLLANPSLGNALFGEPAASAKANALKPARRRKQGIPSWVWLVLSGAVALILVAVAVVILTRSNGDAEWRLAEKDFQDGKDQDAGQKINAFLETFPQHRQASLARVYLGMTKLRQAFVAKSDWDGQLTAAREILPQLVTEPEFPQVRETLAKMLPDMASGLAQQAQAFKGPLEQRHEKVQQALQGLTFAEDWRFVPDKLKPWASLQSTSDQVAQLSREINRGLNLDKSLAAIRVSIAAGSGADAFGLRDKLLQTYPELREGSELDPVIQELVHAAPRLVKIDPQQRIAESKPRATPVIATFADVPCNALSTAADSPTANPKSPSIAVLASGAVYWLQANNGAPLARQFVGLESVPPVPIPTTTAATEKSDGGANSAATDWVVFDAVHKELVCYNDGGTKFRWRQSTVESIESPPLLLGRQLYVATRGGRLAMIDVDSGKWISAAQFPEPLRAAPGVSMDGKTLYVAGEHGTLYTVSARDLRCTAATYVGYGSGSVRLPPTALGAYVVVVENPDWNGSELRVVSIAASDAAPRAVQKITLQGQVVSPPLVAGKQLVLATDKGALMAFDASGSSAFPLIKSMHSQAVNPQASAIRPIASSRQGWFIARAGKELLLAGDGLAHCDLASSASAKRIIIDQLAGTSCQQPPIVQGDRIVVVYRRSEGQGVWVRATNGARQPQWEAVLASPPIGEPMLDADGTSLRLVHPPATEIVTDPVSTPRGDHIAIARLSNAVGPNINDNTPDPNPDSLRSQYLHCSGVVSLPGEVVSAAFSDGSTDVHSVRLFFATAKEPAFHASPLSSPICSPPVGLGKGLLIANTVGQICLVDVATGQSLAAAFQPRLVPGEKLAWRKPAIVPDKQEAIVSDGSTHLYRLGIDQKPSPHLVALAETKVERSVVSDVALNGELAFVADDADNLTALNISDLKPVKGWLLGGRVAWGPCRVGEAVLVATSRELLAIDKQPTIILRMPLDSGIPVGTPLQSGDDLLLATADGIVERLNGKTGQSRAKIDLEQPLIAGPILCGKNLAVVGQDGSIHIVSQP